jgi:hypothetical protein
VRSLQSARTIKPLRRIRAVGPAAKVRIPRRAQVIDATGKFVIPGLVDMHFHPGPADLPRMLAWGFTTVFNPGHDDLASLTKSKALAALDPSRMANFFGVGRAITNQKRPCFGSPVRHCDARDAGSGKQDCAGNEAGRRRYH